MQVEKQSPTIDYKTEHKDRYSFLTSKKLIAMGGIGLALIAGGVYLSMDRDDVNSPDVLPPQNPQEEALPTLPDNEPQITQENAPKQKDLETLNLRQNLKVIEGKPSDTSYTISYTDVDSGETIIETPNKMKEAAGGDMLMLGFKELAEVGVTYKQNLKIKEDLMAYSDGRNDPYERVSVITSTVKHLEDVTKYSFDVRFDEKDKYSAEATMIGINDVNLKLYNSDDELVFER